MPTDNAPPASHPGRPRHETSPEGHPPGKASLDEEMRRVLRAVHALARKSQQRNALEAKLEPVPPGGQSRSAYYEAVLMASLARQIPGALRRIRASKPLSYRIRKIVEALLVLGRLADTGKS